MANVTFYEKPGCRNNTKQKNLLLAAGHNLEEKSLLTEPWKPENLRLFFGDLPINLWVNPSAPRIKSGEVIPDNLNEEEALELMIADPLLIRRPLIHVDGVFRVGFDPEKIDAWIGLNPDKPVTEDLETCPRSHEEKSCTSDN